MEFDKNIYLLVEIYACGGHKTENTLLGVYQCRKHANGIRLGLEANKDSASVNYKVFVWKVG